MSQTQETPSLKVYGRKGTGKNASFRIRLGGMVPAVVYGPKLKTPVSVSVHPNEFMSVYKVSGKTKLVNLECVDGAPSEINGSRIFIKDVQAHAYKNLLQHVDLHQLDLTRKIRVVVPLNFTGKAKGMAEGGIMSIVSRSCEVKALPTDIPAAIEVDVTEVAVNESIHIAELAKKYADAKFEFIYDNDYALVAVVPPEEEKTETPLAAAAGDAPAAGATAAAAPAAAAPAKK